MIECLGQEIYKFNREKIPLYGLLVLLVTMIYNGLTAGKFTRELIIYGFDSIEWIPIIIISISSAFFMMEYKNNTIIMMLYKNSSKLKIYLSKFIVIYIYTVVLTIIAIIMTFLLTFLLAPSSYNWFTVYNDHSLFCDLLLNMLAVLIYCIFSIGLSFMLVMLFKTSAVAICVGLVLAFFGASVSSAVMESFPSIVGITKWNPLSMIFISQQLTRDSLKTTSNLSNPQLIVATIVYGLIFAIIGYYLFKHNKA